MRLLVPALLITLALCACSRAPQPPPVTPEAAALPPADLSSRIAGGEWVAALWELTLDPEGGAASLAPLPLRGMAAQPPQALTYDLDISRFVTNDTFALTGIRFDPGGDLTLEWRHEHPFPAPDLTKPISAKNRADLGYTGRLVVLADTEQRSFFNGEVQVDARLVKAADGYTAVGDLALRGGQSNTHYPYVLLVDELRNNRIGVSNGGLMTGSYDPASGGWQRGNLGATGDRWTGYDYLHGGQASRGRILLRRSALTAAVSIPVALLVKWTDPRGTGGVSRRLPVDPADPLEFAYRLPFAALDVSVLHAPGLIEVPASGTAQVALAVRDWDRGASEAAQYNLSGETDVSLIQPGASFPPIVDFDAPGIAGGIESLLLRSGSGQPADPLRYAGTLQNSQGAAPGAYWSAFRVTDPEAIDPDAPNYHFGVDPITLAADPARAIRPVTVQIAPVVVRDSTPLPERLYATAFAGDLQSLQGGAWIQQIQPSQQKLPGSDGVAMGDIVPGQLRGLLIEAGAVAPSGLGFFTTMDFPTGANRTQLTAGQLAGIHASLAPTAPAALEGSIPFTFLDTVTGAPRLALGDALTGLPLSIIGGLPRALPELRAQGETLFSDLAGPDWSRSNNGQFAVALGTGVNITSSIPPVQANGDIYRIDAATGAATKISNYRTNNTEGGFYPDWHPDGSRLVVLRVNSLNLTRPFGLAVVTVSSGNSSDINLVPMGSPPAPANMYIPIHPVYSRDGTKIAFAALEVSLTEAQVYDSDIWVIDFNSPTATITNVTNTNGVFEVYPFWG